MSAFSELAPLAWTGLAVAGAPAAAGVASTISGTL
jgi:hypothetical protein